MSAMLGSSRSIFATKMSRVSLCCRFAMISAIPKTPIATVTNPIPSESSEMPKL